MQSEALMQEEKEMEAKGRENKENVLPPSLTEVYCYCVTAQ